MKSTLLIALAGVCVATGCSLFIPKECRYLNGIEGRATGEEVQQQLGAPLEKNIYADGWIILALRSAGRAAHAQRDADGILVR